jgi:plasmid maintenance system killer protein
VLAVIASFTDRATEALYHGTPTGPARRIPAQIRAAALRKLDILNATHELTDLWAPSGPAEVRIVDYHS